MITLQIDLKPRSNIAYRLTNNKVKQTNKQLDSPRDSPYFLMCWWKKTAPRKLLRTARYRGERERDGGDRGRGKDRKERDRDMQSKGLGKIRYRAQTSCSLIERLGQEQPLTGNADLKLFPVKSWNKSRLIRAGRRTKAGLEWSDVIDSGYHITHPILFATFSIVLKNNLWKSLIRVAWCWENFNE